MFNNFHISKHHKNDKMSLYLNFMFTQVLTELDYTSDGEKKAIFNIVSNWTSVNRSKQVKVYGKTTPKVEPGTEEVSNRYEFFGVIHLMCLYSASTYK